jgi:hypothetical protein
METLNAQDFKMLEDLKAFAKAIKFQVTTGEDLQTLLKKWVNHRVELTPQVLDNCWNEYLTAKGY